MSGIVGDLELDIICAFRDLYAKIRHVRFPAYTALFIKLSAVCKNSDSSVGISSPRIVISYNFINTDVCRKPIKAPRAEIVVYDYGIRVSKKSVPEFLSSPSTYNDSGFPSLP